MKLLKKLDDFIDSRSWTKGVLVNWGILLGALLYICIHHDAVFSFLTTQLKENPSVAGAIIAFLCSTAFYSYKRRVISTKPIGDFFKAPPEVLNPPLDRLGYSDRMAYILAEFSDLAYYQVERDMDSFVEFLDRMSDISIIENTSYEDNIDQLIENYKKAENYKSDFLEFINEIKTTKPDEEYKEKIKKLRDSYIKNKRSEQTGVEINNEKQLEELLSSFNYTLIKPYIHIKGYDAQGFACVKTNSEGKAEYVVISFRGSEAKFEDWLTNAQASPKPIADDGPGANSEKQAKVHTGFHESFEKMQAEIKDRLKKIYDEHGIEPGTKNLPVFLTGHSLGGALATIATREIMPNCIGACYSYGAPRVGNYAYFDKIKTPVYRIVNSSDIVPRVPPGAGIFVFAKLLGLLKTSIPYLWMRETIKKIEEVCIKYGEYRHFGDMRYLTDTPSDNSEKVRLLRNPSSIDVTLWFWRSIRLSFGAPVKSHGMAIYRKKLRTIAKGRIEKSSS